MALTLSLDTKHAPLTALSPQELEQLRLEDESVDEAGRRLREFVDRLKAKAQFSEGTTKNKRQDSALSRTPAGRTLIVRALEPCITTLTEAVEEAKSGRPGPRHAAVRYLSGVDLEESCITALRILVDGSDRPKNATSIYRKIGHHIFAEQQMLAWAERNEKLITSVLRDFRTNDETHHYRIVRAMMAREGDPVRTPGAEAECQVGAFLADIIMTRTGFFEERKTGSVKHTAIHIVPTQALQEWIRKHDAARAITIPAYKPLVIPPKPWARGANGGYHFALANSRSFVAGAAREESNAIRDSCSEAVLACVNHLQATPWRINRRVLEVYREVLLSGGNLGGIGGVRELALPPPMVGLPRDHNDMTPEQREQFLEWKHRCAAVHEQNREIRQRALRETRTLAVAEQFADYEEFYFAARYDFRGRLYYLSPDLSPQGTDIQRGLLEFARLADCGVSECETLALHGTGRLGDCPFTGVKLDKLPRAERIEWVRAHGDQLRAMAEDPFLESRWQTADDPWQFLAFAFAWANRHSGVHLPCQLDGTTNTFQHFAAASRDGRLACATNVCMASISPQLSETPRPADLYNTVGKTAADAIGTLRFRSQDGRKLPVERLLDRAAAKSVLKKIPYGAAHSKMVDGIAGEHLVKSAPNLTEEERRTVADFLTKQIVETLYATYPSVRSARQFILGLTRATNRLKADLQWTSPSGFPVSQRYRKMRTSRPAVTLVNRMRKRLSIGVKTEALEAADATRGSTANVMHSLDAAHMHLTAAACAHLGIYIGYIHDCILYPADMHEAVLRVLREQFIETHRAPFFEGLLAAVRSMVGPEAKLPEAPTLGDLDIEDVKHSEFLFN